MSKTDIVLCVFNGLQHLRPCLHSIWLETEEDYHLIVVDDGSDEYVRSATTALLERLWENDRYTYLANGHNRGYLATANRGIQSGSSPYVVLLNSDTVATKGWLSGMLGALDSGPDVGAVCPLASHANFTRLDIPPGWSYRDVADRVRRGHRPAHPEIGLASGFCFATRRSHFEQVGLFDPIYRRGYYEESDFCMRLQERGLRIVAADATFIHHHGWGSFGQDGRNEFMARNRGVFERRWGRAHDYWRDRYLNADPFSAIRSDLSGSHFTESGPMAKALAAAQQAIGRLSGERLGLSASAGFTRVHKRAGDAYQRLQGRHVLPSPTYRSKTPGEWREFAARCQPELSRSRSGKSLAKPRVLYVLPGLGAWGGVISVTQIVNRLIQRGFDAQIATYGGVDERFYREQLLFRPFVFESSAKMIHQLPPYDLVVSTRWDTVYDALLLSERWGCPVASFVQDYEPDQVATPSDRRAALLSLDLVQHKIVKSHWLRDKLVTLVGETHRIPLGLNRDIFYPGGGIAGAAPRIVAAARPGAAHRNLEGTLEILRRVQAQRPDARIAFYGRHFDAPGLTYEHHGMLSQPQVAQLLRDSTLLLDASLYQGFGRPGLEAMACGTSAVLTMFGGVNEYARHGENCLQIDPQNIQLSAESVLQLLGNETLRSNLAAEGLSVAAEYDAETEADRTAKLFRQLVSRIDVPSSADCLEGDA